MEIKKQKNCELTLGFYPGILLGARTYEEKDFTTYVFYLPFVDIAFAIDN